MDKTTKPYSIFVILPKLFFWKFLAGFLLFFSFASPSLALWCDDSQQNCILMQLNHVGKIRVKNSINSILIGDPKIISTNIMPNNLLIVTAIAAGSTNMILLDKRGKEISKYEFLVQKKDFNSVFVREATKIQKYICVPYCSKSQ